MNHKLKAAVAAALLVAGLAATGCGDDASDDTDDSAEATVSTATTAAVTGESVEIAMGDFYFDPQDATASAGTVSISAPNEGDVEHELVLFKTNMDPADLPTASNGEVDEEKLAGEAEEVGEVEAEPGETASGEFEMTAGKYVMFCNLPAHYEQGMYGSVTVK
jgi:uncharacterized cupredoxin-like copper-binding protein